MFMCVLYIFERAQLFNNIIANVTDPTAANPPNDYWYDSGRPEWLRWLLFALVIVRVIPFAYRQTSFYFYFFPFPSFKTQPNPNTSPIIISFFFFLLLEVIKTWG